MFKRIFKFRIVFGLKIRIKSMFNKLLSSLNFNVENELLQKINELIEFIEFFTNVTGFNDLRE